MCLFIQIIFTIGFLFILIGWIKNELTCPPPKVLYRYIKPDLIDYQFSELNIPTNINKNLFTDNLIY